MRALPWQAITVAGIAYSSTICFIAFDEAPGQTVKASHSDGEKLRLFIGHPVEVQIAQGIIQTWRKP